MSAHDQSGVQACPHAGKPLAATFGQLLQQSAVLFLVSSMCSRTAENTALHLVLPGCACGHCDAGGCAAAAGNTISEGVHMRLLQDNCPFRPCLSRPAVVVNFRQIYVVRAAAAKGESPE